jgi:hypothetical protein
MIEKECKTCNKKKLATKENFYTYKDTQKLRPECKLCAKKRTAEYKKNKRMMGIPYYTEEQNAKRRYKRLEKKSNLLQISVEDFIKIESEIKKIIKLKKYLNKLRIKLNKNKPKKNSLYYKFIYKIDEMEWKFLTKDNPKEATLIHRIKYKYDESFVLKTRLKNQIIKKSKKYPNIDIQLRTYIKNNSKNNMYENLLGYTTNDLKKHLESKFENGMNWIEFNAGNIHIDHIKPQSMFNLQNINEVKECWSLKNLQPLWAEDNLIKSNNYNKDINKAITGPSTTFNVGYSRRQFFFSDSQNLIG